jgi:hypothetical protein
MAVEVAKQWATSARPVYPVFETPSGFSVTFTGVADSTSISVIGPGWSTATSGASLAGIYYAGVTAVAPAAAEEYDPDFVASILRADVEPPEGRFNNVVDMLNWLNRD